MVIGNVSLEIATWNDWEYKVTLLAYSSWCTLCEYVSKFKIVEKLSIKITSYLWVTLRCLGVILLFNWSWYEPVATHGHDPSFFLKKTRQGTKNKQNTYSSRGPMDQNIATQQRVASFLLCPRGRGQPPARGVLRTVPLLAGDRTPPRSSPPTHPHLSGQWTPPRSSAVRRVGLRGKLKGRGRRRRHGQRRWWRRGEGRPLAGRTWGG
jgi:hypothetical protein